MRKDIVARKRRIAGIRRFYVDLNARYAMTENGARDNVNHAVWRMGNHDNQSSEIRLRNRYVE